MSKDQEIDLSTTASSNTDFGGIGVGEGMPPSDVNNAMRYLAKMRADAITRHVAKGAGTYTAVKSDHNKFWRCTGAVTINLTAAATLTNGWCLWVRANGGAVTIDPNGVEQIDGSATLVLADGQQALILCTGSAFFSVLGNSVLAQPTLVLKQGTSPAPTVEGDVQWDIDDDAIVVGDGVSQKVFRANNWERIFDGAVSGAASKTFTGLSAYRSIRGSGRLAMSTDGASLRLRYSTNNGSSYEAGASEYNVIRTFNDSSAMQAAVVTTTAVGFDCETGVGNAAAEWVRFGFELDNFNQSGTLTGRTCCTFRTTAGAIRQCWVDFDTAGTTTRNALLITSSGGNITGYMVVEGIRG